MLLHSKKYLPRGQVHSLREAMILLSLLLNPLKTLFRVEIQNFMMGSQETNACVYYLWNKMASEFPVNLGNLLVYKDPQNSWLQLKCDKCHVPHKPFLPVS